MTDYTHIPIHVRCTERWKIDPAYPGDMRFWSQVTRERKAGYADGPGSQSTGMNEVQQRAYRYLAEHGWVTSVELIEHIGVSSQRAGHIINGISYFAPVYEEADERGRLTYGLLNA